MEKDKLNPDEVTELLCQARQGNSGARQQLIEMNFRAPIYMARKKCPPWLQQEEALSIANLNLVLAIDNYIKQDINFSLSTVIFQTIQWGFSYERTKKEIYGQYDEYSEATEGFEDGVIPKNMYELDLCHYDNTEEGLFRWETISKVREVLGAMPEERRFFLERYYGFHGERQTFKEIAQEDGISTNKAQLRHGKYLRAFRREWMKRT